MAGQSQEIPEKIAALRSVLPLLHAHHELIHELRIRTSWEGMGVEECRGPSLSGAVSEKRDMAWIECQKSLSHRYRLHAVSLSLQKLNRHKPGWAAAIYYGLIEPWTDWNPDRREEWMENGLEWMAREIPGDVPNYNPVQRSSEVVERRNVEIEDMLRSGAPRRAICRALKVGPNLVAAVAKRYREKEKTNA